MKCITAVDITRISFPKVHFSIIQQFGLRIQSEGDNRGMVHMERERERDRERGRAREREGEREIEGEGDVSV